MAVSIPKRISALAVVLLAGSAMLIAANAASAAPPFASVTQATALVGGFPFVNANCPTGSPGAVAGGNSTNGIVSVGSPAGARCATTAAAADGEYAIVGETVPIGQPSPLRFSADCTTVGVTSGGVDVPTGTSINGGPAVGADTLVTTPNTQVVYPNGTTAILNEVITTGSSVTRNAIRITSGTASGTIVGRVICGASGVYPLAVDVAGASGATPALAVPSSSSSHGGPSTSLLLLGGVAALAVLAQIAVGRKMWRRKGDATA